MYQRGYGLQSYFLKPYLKQVTRQCIENEVPILTSLVVQNTTGVPENYYFIAQRTCHDGIEEDMQTWKLECEAVWREWK